MTNGDPRHLGLLPRQRRGAAGGRRDRRRRAGRAVHAQAARRVVPDPRVPLRARRSGHRLRRSAAVAFYDKPFLKFERLLETYHAFAPRGLRSFVTAMPVWIKEKLFMRRLLAEHLAELGRGAARIFFPEHHLSHAASAFYPSPFDEAAIVTIDGVGEWATTTIGRGRGQGHRDPERAALSAFGRAALFRVHLLPRVHGQQRRIQADGPGAVRQRRVGRRNASSSDKITRELVDIREDGSILLNMAYFDFATGLRMVDEAKWAAAVRPAAPRARVGAADAGLHEHGARHPAGDRGDRAAAGAHGARR